MSPDRPRRYGAEARGRRKERRGDVDEERRQRPRRQPSQRSSRARRRAGSTDRGAPGCAASGLAEASCTSARATTPLRMSPDPTSRRTNAAAAHDRRHDGDDEERGSSRGGRTVRPGRPRCDWLKRKNTEMSVSGERLTLDLPMLSSRNMSTSTAPPTAAADAEVGDELRHEQPDPEAGECQSPERRALANEPGDIGRRSGDEASQPARRRRPRTRSPRSIPRRTCSGSPGAAGARCPSPATIRPGRGPRHDAPRRTR